MQYIYLDDDIYKVDTLEEIAIAEQAMRALGRTEARVHECPYDSVEAFEAQCPDADTRWTGMVLIVSPAEVLPPQSRSGGICEHSAVECSPDMPFSGCVCTPGVTEENEAAHGGVSFVAVCMDCGLSRHVNLNGNHVEYSEWFGGPDAEHY